MYELKNAEKNVKCIDALISECNYETFANLVKQFCFYVPVYKFTAEQEPLTNSIITKDYDGIFCVDDEGASESKCCNFVFLKKRDGILYHLILFFGIQDDIQVSDECEKREILMKSMEQLELGKGMELCVQVRSYNDPLPRFQAAFYYFICFFVNQEYQNQELFTVHHIPDVLERYRGENMKTISKLRVEREKRLAEKKKNPKLEVSDSNKKWQLKKGNCIFCRCKCDSKEYGICNVCMEKIHAIIINEIHDPSEPDYTLYNYEKLLKEMKSPHGTPCTLCGSKKFKIQIVNLRVGICAKCCAVWKMCNLGNQRVYDNQARLSCAEMIKTLPFLEEIIKKLIIKGIELEKAVGYLHVLTPEEYTEFGKELKMEFTMFSIPSTATAISTFLRLFKQWEQQTLKRDEFRVNQNGIFKALKKVLELEQYDFHTCFSSSDKRKADEIWSLLGLTLH